MGYQDPKYKVVIFLHTHCLLCGSDWWEFFTQGDEKDLLVCSLGTQQCWNSWRFVSWIMCEGLNLNPLSPFPFVKSFYYRCFSFVVIPKLRMGQDLPDYFRTEWTSAVEGQFIILRLTMTRLRVIIIQSTSKYGCKHCEFNQQHCFR